MGYLVCKRRHDTVQPDLSLQGQGKLLILNAAQAVRCHLINNRGELRGKFVFDKFQNELN